MGRGSVDLERKSKSFVIACSFVESIDVFLGVFVAGMCFA